MNEPTITCPHCSGTIKLTETLAGPVLEEERRKIEAELRDKADLLDERSRKLESRDEALRTRAVELKAAETEHEQRLEAAVKSRIDAIASQERARAEQASRQAIEAAREELEAKNAELAEMQKTELTLRKERQALEEDRRAFELKLQRALDDERGKIREQTRREDEEQYALKLAEREKVIADMRKQLDEARRKSDQGSQQLQGEVQELGLEAMLRESFPMDIIEPVPKGQHGGDVLQYVVAPGGRRCGSILWESKRTKRWSDQWLQKARDDQRVAGAELAVIMSTALPEGLDTFDQIDGVWVTSATCALAVGVALRQMLVEVASARQAIEGHQDKMAVMYDYLTGPGFRHRVEAIVDAVIGMQTDLDAERRATQRQWAKRDAHMKRLIFGTAGMYGDLQGIAGATLPKIEGLELPSLSPVEVEDDDARTGPNRAADGEPRRSLCPT